MAGIENFLNKLGVGDILGLGKRNVESPQQAQDRITGAGAISDRELADLNAQARAAGYPSYEAMVLRERQRRMGATRTGAGQGAPTDMEAAQQNAMAWHPKNMFERISDAISGALDR